MLIYEWQLYKYTVNSNNEQLFNNGHLPKVNT